MTFTTKQINGIRWGLTPRVREYLLDVSLMRVRPRSLVDLPTHQGSLCHGIRINQ